MNERTIHLTKKNQTEEKLSSTVNTAEMDIFQEDTSYMARDTNDVER